MTLVNYAMHVCCDDRDLRVLNGFQGEISSAISLIPDIFTVKQSGPLLYVAPLRKINPICMAWARFDQIQA
jgi:hypothetical protein